MECTQTVPKISEVQEVEWLVQSHMILRSWVRKKAFSSLTLGLRIFNYTTLSPYFEAQCKPLFFLLLLGNNSKNCTSESFIEPVEFIFISRAWLLCDLSCIPFFRHKKESSPHQIHWLAWLRSLLFVFLPMSIECRKACV